MRFLNEGRIIRAAALAAVLLAVTAAPAQEAESSAGPEAFNGVTMVLNGPARGMVRFRVTVDRWSTPEQRAALAEVLKSKGTDGLLAAMEELTMGRIQFDSNLSRPIRIASSWQTDKGRVVRVATDRPMSFEELNSTARSNNYPFGVMEFLVPPEGKGEGSLFGAVKVQFDDKGRLEVQSLPTNTGPQKLTEIEREVPKPKKAKKKD